MQAVLQLFSTARSRIDICIDHTRPSLVVKIQGVKNFLLDARNRGVKTRVITEITKDNITHCKELVALGDEIRHLDRIKGSFYINELEYLAPAVLHDRGKPASEIIYSNVKELVEHQQYIFDMLWNISIAAEDKMSEIEGGIVSDSMETVIDTFEVQKIIVNLLKSAKQEILVTFSTANAFRRQKSIGSFELLNEAARCDVRIRLLTPENATTAEIKKNLEDNNIDIRYVEEPSQISFIIVDRKFSLVIELKDDSKENTLEAMGFTTYSTRKRTVISYALIFDSLWKLAGLYQQSKDKLDAAEMELANMKEYLNEVLREVGSMKNK